MEDETQVQILLDLLDIQDGKTLQELHPEMTMPEVIDYALSLLASIHADETPQGGA